jgi:DNA-binding MarR family transcriptional regulator
LAKLDGVKPLHTATLQNAAERFGDDPYLPFMLASGSIMQAYRLMSTRVSEALAAVDDLSMPRYEVLGLLVLADDGRLGVRDIKRASLLHPPTLTYILDWLEGRGYVTRKPDNDDRRSVLIQLTAKGRRIFNKAQDALREIHFGLQGLESEDAYAVARALDYTGEE